MISVFQKRFNGSLSLEQELEALTPHIPLWLRPLWLLLLGWLKPRIREAKIKRTMDSVDRQAKRIGDAWAVQDRQRVVDQAVKAARVQNPGAHVEAIEMPDHPVDAVYIEQPPVPGNKAQEALGFSSIEIRAPWAG